MVQRRTILKGAGVATVSGLVGAGVLFGSQTAAATASQDYGSVSITSDDGTVDYVAVYGDSVVEWDGFDTPATHVRIITEGRIKSQVGWTQLNDTGKVDLSNDNWGGHDESLSGQGTHGTIKTGIGLDKNGNHDPQTDWHVVGSDPDGYGLPQNSLPANALEVTSDGGSETYTVQLRSTYIWSGDNGEIYRKSWVSDVPTTVNNEPTDVDSSPGDGASGATGA